MKLFATPRIRPHRPSAARLRFVVVEDGARELDSWVPSGDGDETIVLGQARGEPPASLALAVAKRIAGIERSARSIAHAVIRVGSGVETQVSAARGLVARTLMSHMVAAGCGELMLVGDGADHDVRDELLLLVEALLGEHQQSSVPIRLQFREGAPGVARASGIHPVPDLVDATRAAGEG
jgi:hypothetical protein